MINFNTTFNDNKFDNSKSNLNAMLESVNPCKKKEKTMGDYINLFRKRELQGRSLPILKDGKIFLNGKKVFLSILFCLFSNISFANTTKYTIQDARHLKYYKDIIVDEAFDLIKESEGFKSSCYDDFRTQSIGYGTKCIRKETIDKKEAERRAKNHIKKDLNLLIKKLNDFDEFLYIDELDLKKNVLVSSLSVIYNTGFTSFFKNKKLLNSIFKLENGTQENCNKIYYAFLDLKAQNKPMLYGLIKRRVKELNYAIKDYSYCSKINILEFGYDLKTNVANDVIIFNNGSFEKHLTF